MDSMTPGPGGVTAGVDTHSETFHAAVVDAVGRELGDCEFPATPAGCLEVLEWLRGHGRLEVVGVEGTSSYGAALSRCLRRGGVRVVEVVRPARQVRRFDGKSDPVDAYAAARAALAGTATAAPKDGTGIVEAIRVLKIARRSAVKARTGVVNQIRALLVTAPDELREQLRGLPRRALRDTCAALRPAADIADPLAATKTALRHLARRWQLLDEQAADLRDDLHALVACASASLLARPGVGPDTAAQLLVTAGDNPDRMRTEAAFARLCGAAPIPASSGKTTRHRLHRGGDRAANAALHTIVVTRMRHHEPTRAYTRRRRAEGRTNRETIRCLKRAVAREVYRLLRDDLNQLRHAALTT